ncbi:hypothetical protein PsorP6_007152 [Peronosclerospora sorghi]|uniref:Uncharacterized protein n=1 Tax=Peronosclerospora sorghi TaxID=230839 RepID=A0ACC0W6X5_9STRA|nr:hypothetical protein PsorP6_007152 [Peronosclerospora sorghi]
MSTLLGVNVVASIKLHHRYSTEASAALCPASCSLEAVAVECFERLANPTEILSLRASSTVTSMTVGTLVGNGTNPGH